MARADVLGHLGLLIGLLAVIFQLNGVVVALAPTPGSGSAAFSLAIVLWMVALAFVLLAFVLGERFGAKKAG